VPTVAARDIKETLTMDNELFDYSQIVGREPIEWPGGARIAFYVGLNVEHFLLDRPSTSLKGRPRGWCRTR
jgi:hypothetical protein